MNYADFEKLMQDREVRIEQASSGHPFARLSVRTKDSNVIGLYQVPQSWVSALMILGNWHSAKTWWKESDKKCLRKSS